MAWPHNCTKFSVTLDAENLRSGREFKQTRRCGRNAVDAIAEGGDESSKLEEKDGQAGD